MHILNFTFGLFFLISVFITPILAVGYSQEDVNTDTVSKQESRKMTGQFYGKTVDGTETTIEYTSGVKRVIQSIPGQSATFVDSKYPVNADTPLLYERKGRLEVDGKVMWDSDGKLRAPFRSRQAKTMRV